MSTYNINKIKLPNGDICNLRDAEAARISDAQRAYDLAASKTSNTGTVTSVTLTAGNGISITDNSVPITTIGGRTITNTGVTSVSQGNTNGTINVTTNGSTSSVAIRGLGSAAYTASTAYATAAQGGKADAAMPKSGGTFTGAVTLHSDPTANLMAATKQYVDNNVSISDNLSSGTKIATITINGVNTDLYSPGTPQTISVTQSSSTPTLEFITSTNSSNSSTLTGVTTTVLANGKMIVYCLAYALTGDPVTLTLSDTLGTSLGNYPVYIDGTTQCSNIYHAGTMLFLVFYNNKFTIVNPFGLAG